MSPRFRLAVTIVLLFATLATTAGFTLASAQASELSGTKTITLHSRDGAARPIGQVTFGAAGVPTAYTVDFDHRRFKDFFLSMKEFKCLESEVGGEGGGEVFCHVPYPYAHPQTVTASDLSWLEHELLFFFKTPQDFGAKLWNGIVFRLETGEKGLTGTPQAIDLNLIGVPPDKAAVPPYGAAERSDIDPARRWFNRITIE